MAVVRTVGQGGNYANWPAAMAALQSFSPLLDDYEFVQVSNISENSSGPNFSCDLNGHSVVLRSTQPHQGDPTKGYKVTSSVSGVRSIGVNVNTTGGAGSFEIKDLHFEYSSGEGYPITIVTDITPIKIHDILATSSGLLGNGIAVQTPTGGAEAPTVHLWNLVTYNFEYGIRCIVGSDAVLRIENCTAYKDAAGTSINLSVELGTPTPYLVNCFAKDFSGSLGVCIGLNNTSEGISASNFGPGSSGNRVYGSSTAWDQFASLVRTDPNFMKILDTGLDYNDGYLPLGIPENVAGIRGNARPYAYPLTSRGADEFFVPSPGPGSAGGGGISPAVGVAIMAGRV